MVILLKQFWHSITKYNPLDFYWAWFLQQISCLTYRKQLEWVMHAMKYEGCWLYTIIQCNHISLHNQLTIISINNKQLYRWHNRLAWIFTIHVCNKYWYEKTSNIYMHYELLIKTLLLQPLENPYIQFHHNFKQQ